MNYYDYVERSKSFFLSDIENRSSDLNYIINNINYKQLEIKKEIKNLKNSSTEKNIFKYYKEQFYKMFI